jgi:hypothetical protein
VLEAPIETDDGVIAWEVVEEIPELIAAEMARLAAETPTR